MRRCSYADVTCSKHRLLAAQRCPQLAHRPCSQCWPAIVAAGERLSNEPKQTIPDELKEVYRTIGGVPHLDDNYTVFGEVVEGLEVIDAIAAVETGQADRPHEDVYIIKVEVLN